MMIEPQRKLPGELIKPSGGRHHLVGLLAGGSYEGWLRLREQFQNERGIHLAHHWEERKIRQWEGMVPMGVDVVLVLKWTGHPYYEKAVRAAERSNNLRGTNVQVFWIDQAQPSTLDKLGFFAKPPIPNSALYKKTIGDSSQDVEQRLASIGERNAEIAEMQAALDALDERTLDTTAQAPVEPAAAPQPLVAEPNVPLLATLTRLLELMAHCEIKKTDAQVTSSGGSVDIRTATMRARLDWEQLQPANDNAPSK